MTNLERIRNADEKELAEILAHEVGHGDCYDCPADCSGDTSCHDAWANWLHEEVEEPTFCKDCHWLAKNGTCNGLGSRWIGRRCANYRPKD